MTNLLRHATPSFRSISWDGRRPSITPRGERPGQLVTAHSLSLRMAEIVRCRPTGNWIRTLVRIWRMCSESTNQILTISSGFGSLCLPGCDLVVRATRPQPWLCW
ncbi:hypothetical protein MRX96_049424 [Rhipicephalus microplus]